MMGIPVTPDATTTLKGKVQLAGDLAGTAAAPTVVAASATTAGKIEIAVQSEQEAGTDNTRAVSPAVQHYHLSAAKCFCKVTVSGGTPTLDTDMDYNITSITDDGAGELTITVANDFSTANWICQVTVQRATTATGADANARIPSIRSAGQAAGSVAVEALTAGANFADPAAWYMTGHGDL